MYSFTFPLGGISKQSVLKQKGNWEFAAIPVAEFALSGSKNAIMQLKNVFGKTGVTKCFAKRKLISEDTYKLFASHHEGGMCFSMCYGVKFWSRDTDVLSGQWKRTRIDWEKDSAAKPIVSPIGLLANIACTEWLAELK